jgi:hypothetical protein
VKSELMADETTRDQWETKVGWNYVHQFVV